MNDNIAPPLTPLASAALKVLREHFSYVTAYDVFLDDNEPQQKAFEETYGSLIHAFVSPGKRQVRRGQKSRDSLRDYSSVGRPLNIDVNSPIWREDKPHSLTFREDHEGQRSSAGSKRGTPAARDLLHLLDSDDRTSLYKIISSADTISIDTSSTDLVAARRPKFQMRSGNLSPHLKSLASSFDLSGPELLRILFMPLPRSPYRHNYLRNKGFDLGRMLDRWHKRVMVALRPNKDQSDFGAAERRYSRLKAIGSPVLETALLIGPLLRHKISIEWTWFRLTASAILGNENDTVTASRFLNLLCDAIWEPKDEAVRRFETALLGARFYRAEVRALIAVLRCIHLHHMPT